MAFANNAFCWNGIITTDVDATLAFFPEVLGWSVQRTTMDGDEVVMLANAERPIAHVRSPQMEGEPSWWNNYLRVEDVDAAVEAVEAQGGKVLVPPTDIVPGRFATVTTPSGAAFTLFHEASEEDSTDAPSSEGFVHWIDLHSTDIEADLAFLKSALGFATQTMDMPNGPYHILDPEGAARAGAMKGAHPEAPSMWMSWVAVGNVDETLERVSRHGGKVVGPAWEAPGVGRMAIAADPAGVTFGIITPPAE